MNADAPPIAADKDLKNGVLRIVAPERTDPDRDYASLNNRRQSAGHRRSSAFPKSFGH